MIRSGARFALGLVAAAAGCSLTTSFDGLTGGGADGGAPPDATTDATTDATADAGAPDSGADGPPPSDAGADGACVGAAGPVMVSVGPFCIDTTEVTNDQYQVFLDAVVQGGVQQPPECASNTNFTPTIAWPPSTSTKAKPVVGIDWCDAHAYCTWAGKRLCGAVDGGATASADFATAADQWHFACSHGGAADHVFPYGMTYDPARCNDLEYRPEAGVLPVGTVVGCVGGFPGIFDMSGNVEEWEDSCALGAGGVVYCRNRGGAFPHTGATVACAADSTNVRDFVSDHTGVRCCSP